MEKTKELSKYEIISEKIDKMSDQELDLLRLELEGFLMVVEAECIKRGLD